MIFELFIPINLLGSTSPQLDLASIGRSVPLWILFGAELYSNWSTLRLAEFERWQLGRRRVEFVVDCARLPSAQWLIKK